MSEVDTVHPIGGTRGVVPPTSDVFVGNAGAVEQDLTRREATERTIHLPSGSVSAVTHDSGNQGVTI